MIQPNPKVDAFIEREKKWKSEFQQLRKLFVDTTLTEEFKWGVPCYALNGKNVVLMHGFNEYCALLFIKGVLLKDPLGVLITQTENVQSARQIRFTSTEQIEEMENVLKGYIQQAIEVEKAGMKVDFKPASEFKMAEEFKSKMDELPDLKTAFYALTPGRQRAYLLFFSAPKQSATRVARVDKSIPLIMAGKGLND